jgi:hypothetical protein
MYSLINKEQPTLLGPSRREAQLGLGAPLLDKGVGRPRALGMGQIGPMGWPAKAGLARVHHAPSLNSHLAWWRGKGAPLPPI